MHRTVKNNYRPDKTDISLSQEHALVLFEFLSRFQEGGKLQILHPAEEKALWILQGLVEKQLVEPFMENYTELLETARQQLVAE